MRPVTVATPESAVFTTDTDWARVAASAPVTVTVAPTMTAWLGSTTVTRSVAVAAGCANPRMARAIARQKVTRAVFIMMPLPLNPLDADRHGEVGVVFLRYLTIVNEEMSCPNRGQCVPQAVSVRGDQRSARRSEPAQSFRNRLRRVDPQPAQRTQQKQDAGDVQRGAPLREPPHNLGDEDRTE